MSSAGGLDELDPFDLPDWLGEAAVTWAADRGMSGHLVAGMLTGPDEAGLPPGLPLDLLAVDQAFPAPVVDEATRTAAHRAWRHGQALLLSRDGRATVAVPGTSFAADRVFEAVRRVARAVGADPAHWAVRINLS